MHSGRRLAAVGVLASGGLAAANLSAGWLTGSVSVTAAGVEFAGDVLASGIVWAGLAVASRPADANHPYGHGRYESLSGLLVGLLLAVAGLAVCVQSMRTLGALRPPPHSAGLAALAASIVVKTALSWAKFRVGRRIGSAALVADGWNDLTDVLAGATATAALGLAVWDPSRFRAADSLGGFAVGLIMVMAAVGILRSASLVLTDAMPSPELVRQIRAEALRVDGVLDVEKAFARKTGLQYHVDLHVGVAPSLSVDQGHQIAGAVRRRLRASLPWVADVLVHVEPHQAGSDE
ncbi:MAG: cation transporter [Bryobacterales bacterium]|nr:cation transporter [Bryobacterales bacterium]